MHRRNSHVAPESIQANAVGLLSSWERVLTVDCVDRRVAKLKETLPDDLYRCNYEILQKKELKLAWFS